MLATLVQPYEGWAPVILRLALGVIFIIHGYPKLFKTPSQFAGFLKSLKVPTPYCAAVLIAVLEFWGGFFLIAGLFTRWIALLLAVEMFVASMLVKRKFVGGWEFDFSLLAMALSLLILGAGMWSLDGYLVR